MGDRTKSLGLKPESVLAKKRAERMRIAPTPQEQQILEAVQSWGHKTRAQEIFMFEESFYIADIYLPKCRTVLELDGRQHAEQVDYDLRRDSRIAEHGFGNILVVRIPNYAVTDPLFLNELRSFLERRKADVAASMSKLFYLRRREHRAFRLMPNAPPVAAERHICACVECGNSFQPADTRKDAEKSMVVATKMAGEDETWQKKRA